MPFFKDSQQLYDILGNFFYILKDDPEIGPKVIASGLIIQFKYSEPDAVITIDCPNQKIIFGQTDLIPTVEMSMKADIAHKFWLGKINLMIALTKREIIAKGPIPKIMQLLPIIKNSYGMYKKFLTDKGLTDLIIN